MGEHLNNFYGDQYFNIAFDTYEGFVNNIEINDVGFQIETHEIENPKNNFTQLFASAKTPNFYLYMGGRGAFSGVKNTMTNIYSDWRKPFIIPVKFPDNFDALIFIKKTTPSKVLQKSN